MDEPKNIAAEDRKALLIVDEDGHVSWGIQDIMKRAQIAEELFIKSIGDIAVVSYNQKIKCNISDLTLPKTGIILNN